MGVVLGGGLQRFVFDYECDGGVVDGLAGAGFFGWGCLSAAHIGDESKPIYKLKK